MRPYCSLFLLCLFTACAGEPTPADTTEAEALPEQNQGNLDIYEVDPEDPYEMDEDGFLGIRVGDLVSTHRDGLRTEERGGMTAYYLDGADGQELGYVLPAADGTVALIAIQAPNVVTRQGIRVGTSFGELTERIGQTELLESETAGQVYARKDGITYRLKTFGNSRLVPPMDIEPEALVTEILLQ